MRGVYAAALLMGLATSAAAQQVASFNGSQVSIAPTNAPNAVAKVSFANDTNNTPYETGTEQSLSLDGMTVTLTFEHGPAMDPDTIYIEPPAGYIAVPPVLTVEENRTGTALIYPLGEVS